MGKIKRQILIKEEGLNLYSTGKFHSRKEAEKEAERKIRIMEEKESEYKNRQVEQEQKQEDTFDGL